MAVEPSQELVTMCLASHMESSSSSEDKSRSSTDDDLESTEIPSTERKLWRVLSYVDNVINITL
jgi:hypothetical protein